MQNSERLNSLLSDYRDAFKESLIIRKEFSKKTGYVREKVGDEKSYHEAKKAFGDFTFGFDEVMEINTNNDKGVDVKLSNGRDHHINNQLELFHKVIELNRKNGGFYDEPYIQQASPADATRLFESSERLLELRQGIKSEIRNSKKMRETLKIIEDEVRGEVYKKNDYAGKRHGFEHYNQNFIMEDANAKVVELGESGFSSKEKTNTIESLIEDHKAATRCSLSGIEQDDKSNLNSICGEIQSTSIEALKGLQKDGDIDGIGELGGTISKWDKDNQALLECDDSGSLSEERKLEMEKAVAEIAKAIARLISSVLSKGKSREVEQLQP